MDAAEVKNKAEEEEKLLIQQTALKPHNVKRHFTLPDQPSVSSRLSSHFIPVPLSSKVAHKSSFKYLWSKGNKREINGSQSYPEPKSSTMIRAGDVQSKLGTEFPSFVKALVRSHVSSCFWMSLPGPFCVSHLPKNDTTITLEDEDGAECETKFIAYKTALSGGWRRFSIEHKLLEGDVLVFQLVRPTKFKVYIIRSNNLKEADGAQAQSKQNDADDVEFEVVACKSKKRVCPKSPVVQKKDKTMGTLQTLQSVSYHGQTVVKSEIESEEVSAEVLVGSKFGVPAVQFKDVNSFWDFNVLVNRMVICFDVSEHIRKRYYELCCSQNAFLHEHLVKGINSKLIAGVISETVNVADALRACKLSTSFDDFSNWDKTLKGFELLGMNVGFLRVRLQRLRDIAFESDGAMDRKLYMEARTKKASIEDQKRNVEAKLAELKEACNRYSIDILALKPKVETHELNFAEEVTAPW